MTRFRLAIPDALALAAVLALAGACEEEPRRQIAEAFDETLLSGCSMTEKGKLFPQGFLWGAATSSHQIEGDNQTNDWWEWEKRGLTPDHSGKACESYLRFEEDFDLAKSMHHNAHRFSLEWSRLEPEEGRWNHEAIEHYRKIVRALKDRGLEPVVTLNHFTLPRWVAHQGGWENPQITEWFLRFSRHAVRNLGADVRFWVTVNEQNVMTFKGYLEREWPPGKRSIISALKVTRHVARAHSAVYHMIHQTYASLGWQRPWVGLAHHFMCCEPQRAASPWDRIAAGFRRFMNNDLFMRLVWRSRWSLLAFCFGLHGEERALDFIGVNYYFREIIRGKKKRDGWLALVGDVAREDERYVHAEHNDLGWEVYPDGIQWVLKDLHRKFHLPLLITENGICTTNEEQRKRFIYRHLHGILECIESGVHVLGYLHWSLLDNFEWAIGYAPKFGLVNVDFKTQKRTAKDSAWYYAEICRENALPPELPSS